jgi:thiol-disulfide isomerase/thioredoxin
MAEATPWQALLGATLTTSAGEQIDTATLTKFKTVSLYFSAHWCPPCRGFTPRLAQAYSEYQASAGDAAEAEVVFVSADRSAQSFQEYHKEMPFPAVPFAGGKELRSGLWCAWNSSARRARRSRAGRALRCLYRRTLPGRTARCCRVPVVFGAREGPEERGKVQGRRDQSVEGWRRGRLLPICRRQRRLAGAHAQRSSVGVGCSPSCTLV